MSPEKQGCLLSLLAQATKLKAEGEELGCEAPLASNQTPWQADVPLFLSPRGEVNSGSKADALRFSSMPRLTHVHLTCPVQDAEIRSFLARGRHSPSESEYACPRVFAQQPPRISAD